MLRVTIELIPHGDESRARTIGSMEIVNTQASQSRPAYGDYAITAVTERHGTGERVETQASIEGYYRANSVWRLVSWAALETAEEEEKDRR